MTDAEVGAETEAEQHYGKVLAAVAVGQRFVVGEVDEEQMVWCERFGSTRWVEKSKSEGYDAVWMPAHWIDLVGIAVCWIHVVAGTLT